MSIKEIFETKCKDNLVRSTTTTEHIGYDVYHKDDALHTVEKHNMFTNLLTKVTAQQAQVAMEEGSMVLWNAGNSGKHFIVDYTKEVTV